MNHRCKTWDRDITLCGSRSKHFDVIEGELAVGQSGMHGLDGELFVQLGGASMLVERIVTRLDAVRFEDAFLQTTWLAVDEPQDILDAVIVDGLTWQVSAGGRDVHIPGGGWSALGWDVGHGST